MNEQADHIFKRDVADGVFLIRQTNEAVERGRKTQQRRHRLAAVDAVELQAHRETEVRNEGERMRRVDGQRRQHRENTLFEFRAQPGPIRFGKCRRTHDEDFFLGEILLQNGKRSLLLHLQIVDFLQNIFELLGRRLAVGRLDGDLLTYLAFKTGDADHEEFIEIGGRDGKETQTLQKRVIRVQRFLENAAIKLEPGKFAVDETRRAVPKALALSHRLNLVEVVLRDSVHSLFHPLTYFRPVILLHRAIVLLARITV
ncbi:hypothetical protein D3C78_1107320 [compost metagenome]